MKHTYNEVYPRYFKYLEVNFTVPVEEPPKIFFNTILKNGRKI